MLLIVSLWRKQPGAYFCVSTKSSSGKWRDNFFKKSELGKVGEFINDNLDKDVYFCPHGFTKPQRLKEHAVAPRLLYADLDAADPRKFDLKPTVALESSPNRYVGFWEADKPVTEELNRRLSYSIAADISGWDFTQVLRVPNTRNFKYHNSPKVRILWNDGPIYEVDRLEKMIPQIKTIKGSSEINADAAEVFREYEAKMPRWLRRELINGKPTAGARSEMLWKLQNELLEIGCSRDETFTLLWSCPWNKFRHRRGGEDQLWREIDKSLDNHMVGGAPKKRQDVAKKKVETEEDEDDFLAFNPYTKMSDVKLENINWVIPGLFARREVTIIEGDPGLGKSYFVQVAAIHICDGKAMPSEIPYELKAGRVLYFDLENTAGSVTKPRLIENGIENMDNYFQGEEPFSVDDEDRWEMVVEAIEELKPDMIVFDTINTYIGKADTNNSAQTQQALGQFKKLAVRFDCAVVIVRHLTKSSKEKALYRGQGSIAFTGLARIVWTIGQMPDDADVRVAACTKNNISAKPRSFTYRIDGLPDTKTSKNRSKLSWGEFVDLTADDIMSVAPIKNKDAQTSIKWLKDLLETRGRQEMSKVLTMAKARSFDEDVIQRAADQLGVLRTTQGEGAARRHFWALQSGDETPNEKESRGRKHLQKSTLRSVTFPRNDSPRKP